MYLPGALYSFIIFFSLGQRWTEAKAIPGRAGPRPARAKNVAPDPISIYTKENFLSHALYDCLPCNSCLFYTYSLTATAQRYARGSKFELITIWDIWPSGLYNGNISDQANPLRSIFSDPKHTRTYYENMSSAMAELCGGSATVMTKDPGKIPLDGIWGTSELPTLKREGNKGGQIQTVIAIDAKGDNSETLWENPKPKKEHCANDLRKRSLSERQGIHKYSPEQLQKWFADVPF